MYGLTDTTDTGKTPAQVAAEKRKNDKTDEKRKLGTQARHEMQAVQGGAVTPPQAAPPPPPSATPTPPTPREPVPQIAPSTGNVPQETSPTFTPAQYKPPAKGLEYLALGLGVLFPGAPIASLAAGAARGLQQGSENSYQRREKEAEQQYKAQQDKARTDFDNAQAQAQAADLKKKQDFQNAQIRYQAQAERDQQMRAQGLDPLTGKEFVKPPELAKPLPPHASAYDLFQREQGLAQFYTGKSPEMAAQHEANAKQWFSDVERQQASAASLQRTLIAGQMAYQRTQFVQANENARHSDSEANAWNRQIQRELFDSTKGTRPADTSKLKEQAAQKSVLFERNWQKLVFEPVYAKDAQGNPVLDRNRQPVVKKAPAISSDEAKSLAQIFKQIDKDQADPVGVAQHLAEAQPNSAARELINERGEVAQLNLLSRGGKVTSHPDSWYTTYDAAMKKLSDEAAARAARMKAAAPPPAAKHGSILDWIQGLMGHKPDAAPAAAAPSPEAPAAGVQTKVNPANGKTYYLHADGNYYLSPP